LSGMFREPYVTCPQIAGLRTAAVTGRRLHDRLLAELRSAAVKYIRTDAASARRASRSRRRGIPAVPGPALAGMRIRHGGDRSLQVTTGD
jgi:hypothetical protein